MVTLRLAELAEGTGVRRRPDLGACSDGRGVIVPMRD
jgi:hypothetical protein